MDPDPKSDSAPAPGGARTPDASSTDAIFGADGMGGQPDIPDMRRDAIEEASETSTDARERIDLLNAREAAADPALRRTS